MKREIFKRFRKFHDVPKSEASLGWRPSLLRIGSLELERLIVTNPVRILSASSDLSMLEVKRV